MKYCSVCKTYNPDGVDKCPLCGSELIPAGYDRKDMVQAPYKVKDVVRPHLLGRKVAWILSAAVLLGLLLTSAISGNWSVIAVGVTSVAMAWLLIFRFVFYKVELKRIYFKVGTAISLLALVICGHFEALRGNYMYIAISYIIPGVLLVILIASLLTAYAKKQWQTYCFGVIADSLLIFAILPTNCVLKYVVADGHYNFILSIIDSVVAGVGLIFAMIFGKELVKTEIKKRFFVFHKLKK